PFARCFADGPLSVHLAVMLRPVPTHTMRTGRPSGLSGRPALALLVIHNAHVRSLSFIGWPFAMTPLEPSRLQDSREYHDAKPDSFAFGMVIAAASNAAMTFIMESLVVAPFGVPLIRYR
ncbi:MAG TPA: hypothetical protein PLD46_08165, partial [Hyphomicrobium sp.]|nr:hypothetical protein [Hyphomicrobium sp.]